MSPSGVKPYRPIPYVGRPKKGDRLLFSRLGRTAPESQGRFKSTGCSHVLLPRRSAVRSLPIDALAQAPQFVIEQRFIEPLVRIHRFLHRPWVNDLCIPEARPWPRMRMGHEPRTHWIADDIAHDGQKVVVMLYRKALEASLPDMAMTPVVMMITPHMTGHPPLHKGPERIAFGRLQDEVKMVGHQTESKHFDRIGAFGNAKQIEEGPVVTVLMEDDGASIPTINDVVDLSGHLPSWNARHGRT